jgi:TrmH family RNA methyltransferase
MLRIASKENPTFRRVLSIRAGKPEPIDGTLVLLEGFRLCEEALASGCRALLLAFSETAALDPRASTLRDFSAAEGPVVVFSDILFRRLCRTEEPQGFLLLCESPEIKGLPFAADPNGRYLVLEEIRDPGNIGTMLRTADAAGVTSVILTPGCVDPFNDKALRASMGSVFHIPVHRAPLIEVSVWLHAAGLPLIAADLNGEGLFETEFPGKGAVLIGNEAEGLSRTALDCSDLRVSIPMPGRAESLNAAAAAAILVYEMLKTSDRGHEGAQTAPGSNRKEG